MLAQRRSARKSQEKIRIHSVDFGRATPSGCNGPGKGGTNKPKWRSGGGEGQ